jgi:hypothetical protein
VTRNTGQHDDDFPITQWKTMQSHVIRIPLSDCKGVFFLNDDAGGKGATSCTLKCSRETALSTQARPKVREVNDVTAVNAEIAG